MAPPSMFLLVYDSEEKTRNELRRVLARYSVERDIDLRMDWLSREAQESRIPELAAEAHITLINADMGLPAFRAGELVLEHAPLCMPVYYGTGPAVWRPLLAARPIAFLDLPGPYGPWEAELTRLWERVLRADCLRWAGKSVRYFIPYSAITCIQSERNTLVVNTRSGSSYRLGGKLDEMEKRVPAGLFLRLHKSTLVNLSRIRVFDKGRRCVVLEDGSELYISRAHYKETADRLSARREVKHRD